MKTTLLSLFLCLGLLFQLNAQEVNPKLAEALQNALDSMHNLLGINGLSAAVQLPNDAVWAGGSGVSTFSPVDSITPNHIFATGSSTKTVVSVCILQLVDEGQLELDDSLHHWLPDFQHIDHNITIRQLLQHTSGIYDVLQNAAFQPSMLQNINLLWELEDVINTFIQPPAFQPGTSWGYSNTNFLLLGMIIETVTGQSFHDEVKERFFTPLGLESFINIAYDPLPADVAHLWLDLNGDGTLDDAHNFITGWKSMFSAVGPAGGYFAQTQDLARWMRLAMSGSLCSPESWAEATTTVPSQFSGNTQYGLGLMKRTFNGLTGYGHGGDLSYSTNAWYFPEKDISIAVQANDASINSWQLINTIRALLNVYVECEAVLSTAEKAVQNQIQLSYLPAQNTLQVQLPSATTELHLQLVNLNGQVLQTTIYRKLSAGLHHLPLDGLNNQAKGIYVAEVWGKGMGKKGCKLMYQADRL